MRMQLRNTGSFFLVTHQGLRGAEDALRSGSRTKAAFHGTGLNCSVVVTRIPKAESRLTFIISKLNFTETGLGACL